MTDPSTTDTSTTGTAQNRIPRVGVGVVVINDRGEVLMIRRGQPPRAGEWSLPGGKQEWGETVEQAARREVAEETGMDLGPLTLVDVVDGLFPGPDGTLAAHYTLVDFAARPIGGVLCAGSDAMDACFMPLQDALAAVDWSETRRILLRAADLLNAAQLNTEPPEETAADV